MTKPPQNMLLAFKGVNSDPKNNHSATFTKVQYKLWYTQYVQKKLLLYHSCQLLYTFFYVTLSDFLQWEIYPICSHTAGHLLYSNANIQFFVSFSNWHTFVKKSSVQSFLVIRYIFKCSLVIYTVFNLQFWVDAIVIVR